MFKRSEKKIKAVFKMQFQATNVPQMKAKSLMISLVPVDVGKATLRLPKAPIIEGTCVWENPVYETLKLVQEVKTGRIREKFYYVVVSTGSSKSGFLGEVSIDFADLFEATRPVNLTLPLQTSKSGTVLNVTVQRMQGGGSDSSRHGEDGEDPVDESNDRGLDTSGNLSETTSPRDELDGSVEDVESDIYFSEARDGARATSEEKSANQIKALERRVELSDLEVLSLRKQIMKENAKGQKLSEQITGLKEERDNLRRECEQLKSSAKFKNEESVAAEVESMRSSLEDVQSQLQREKQLNKKLKLQVEKAEDSNSELVIGMRDLTKKMELRYAEISRLSSKVKEMEVHGEGKAAQGNNDEVATLKKELEVLNSEIEVLKKEKAETQMEVERLSSDYESLEMENRDILSKLEQNEKEKMDIQQNHLETLANLKQFKSRVLSLEEEVKRQKRLYSESLDMIDELEIQVESMQRELENQAQVFEDDLERVTVLKVEQEKRAIKAEEALKQAKSKAEEIQREMEQYSAEMSLRAEENEEISEKAVSEANELRSRNRFLEEELCKANEELVKLKDQYEKLVRERIEQKNDKDRLDKLEEWISEKEDLERELARVTKEADNLKTENAYVKAQADQKMSKEENLQLEVKKMRLKNSEVRNQLIKTEKEKESLQREILKLKDGLHKKQQVLHKVAKEPRTDCADVSGLSTELASLHERNKSMERELQEMQDRYSEISLRFAEVEGQRQQLVMELRNLKTGKKN